METTYYSLATKSNFNKALNHFFKVNEVVEDVESGQNFADVINSLLYDDEIESDQILPIIGAVIRDKYKYSYDSFHIPSSINDFSKIVAETEKWTAVDLFIVYFNASNEVFLINPKNSQHWERVRELSKDQLIILYSKFIKDEEKPGIEKEAINAVEEMIAGRDVFINKEFVDDTVMPKSTPKKEKPVSEGKRQMTPKYSITVTNELFHNGNVEAWKKIIESFETAHPDLEVHIYHEGEKINDINSLFKWGKVKHGDPIFFQVVGENIKNVSKLQKYLYEGASQRFEQFLKIGVGKVLNLF